MKVLIFGAGPLGSLYAHLFHQSGADITLLARGERLEFLRDNGLVLINEITAEQSSSEVKVVSQLAQSDAYDLVIVLVRKNKLGPIFETVAGCGHIRHILFMGNNTTGFSEYLDHLPSEKLLFGFPSAGGGLQNQIVHYADREKPGSKRRAVILGEIDGQTRERTLEIKSLFETAGVPVELTLDIDGWLRYHVALVSPFCGALYKHHCDNYKAAKDKDVIRALVKAAKEGRDVLKSLGYRELPQEFKLISWLPEFMSRLALKGMMGSKFAEVAFALHAEAARDEMAQLATEFEKLIQQTEVATPNINRLRGYISEAKKVESI